MAESGTNRRTVVFAVDASEHSERAFDWYIKNICDKERDNVVLTHAQEYPAIPVSSYDDSSTYYDVYLREVGKHDREVKKLLDAFAEKCKLHGVNFKLYKEESNRPGEVLCKVAKEQEAQVIVMGSRGMGTLRRTLLGSVSDYCVHHSHIPVTIVPPPNRHDNHAHSS